MKRIIETFMISIFFLMYTFILKQLTYHMPISPMSNVIQLFWSAIIKMESQNSRNTIL